MAPKCGALRGADSTILDMRLVGRIFLGLVITAAAVGGTVAGCAGDPERYDAYINENPNIFGGYTGSTTTSTATGTTSTTTGSGSAGQACQCALGLIDGTTNCSICGGAMIGGTCAAQQASCDTECNSVLMKLPNCLQAADPAGCIAGLLQTNAALVALIDCECNACPSCQSATPVACDLSGPADAGADGG